MAPAFAALLAGCDGPPDQSGASASEARQLNDAAAVLDANAISPEAVGIDNQVSGQ